MPGWDIHEKYGGMMGIDPEIQRKVDTIIDNTKDGPHDFYDAFIEKVKTPKFRAFSDRRIIWYNFYSADFRGTELYNKIERYGPDGFRSFFLHVFLDIIERNLRYSPDIDIIELKDFHGLLREYVNEVGEFVNEHIEEIIADITQYEKRKGRTQTRTAGMIKGNYKNVVLQKLFADMHGFVQSKTKPMYYRSYVKHHSIEEFLEELRRNGDLDTFLHNLRKNIDYFKDEEVFPQAAAVIRECGEDRAIENEESLVDLLKALFK